LIISLIFISELENSFMNNMSWIIVVFEKVADQLYTIIFPCDKTFFFFFYLKEFFLDKGIKHNIITYYAKRKNNMFFLFFVKTVFFGFAKLNLKQNNF
jgi:hypothetical protein